MPLAPADILFAADSTSTLHIEWLPDPPHFPPPVQAYLDERWQLHLEAARAAGKSLFNGPVTLYRGRRIEGSTLTLILSPGDYKTHLVTAVRDRSWFTANAPDFILPSLGNSVLLTVGDQVALGIRSPDVTFNMNRAHVFGGVVDPLGTPDMPATTAGLIKHLEHELSEELGLSPADMIGAPRLLGLFCDPRLMQPELTWHWATTASLTTLRQRIATNEHAALTLLPLFSAASDDQKSHAADLLTPLARTTWQKLS